MRIPTRCATTHRSRTLHSSPTQTQNCLLDPQVAHCPPLTRLTSTIHHRKSRQVKKMPISFRHSTSHAPHTLLDLLPSLQTQAMSARLLKRSPPSLFPSHHTTSAPSLTPTQLPQLYLFLRAQKQRIKSRDRRNLSSSIPTASLHTPSFYSSIRPQRLPSI